MPERPLLILPTPSQSEPPDRTGRGPQFQLPSRSAQLARFGPQLNRLREVLSRADGALELSNDPSSLAPDRVVVFEVAGTVQDFTAAVALVPGLEFMAEYEAEFAPDEDFAVKDTRKGRAGQIRADRMVNSRLYLAMPDVQALRQLLTLWDKWKAQQRLPNGFAPFSQLFRQLHAVRPWGPLDRIPEETVRYWQEETERHPNRPVRTEVELWFYHSEPRRRRASQGLRAILESVGGAVVDEAIIPDIVYHGALIDIPAGEIQTLAARRAVRLVMADDVMILRPQSFLRDPVEAEPIAMEALPPTLEVLPQAAPIAALFDGVPVPTHAVLDNRLILDDPDDLQSQAIVEKRLHATAMASLILHGDLNAGEPTLDRRVYVRPLMYAPLDGEETSDENRLLVDTIYRAVLRMKGSEGEQATAPMVFLVNLSVGDRQRPFTGNVSPLARLLDYLSDRYNLLFLVSGGNITLPLAVPSFSDWTSFEQATPEDRERAIVEALNSAKYERTLLSPAESINALTIGAHHHDHVDTRGRAAMALDPFVDSLMPNVSSALGLGYRRSVKPDIYFPGGREHVSLKSSGDGLDVKVSSAQRLFGIKAAAPDPSGAGRPNVAALISGTSAATALATRAAHRIFDAIMDKAGGSLLADIDPQFYAVVVKALLVHRARWSDSAEMIKDLCGPDDRHRHVERSENACRFLGFGAPRAEESCECSANRATLVGFGALMQDDAHNYRIPLPACLERVTDPRTLTITLAWLSPVKPGHQSYRGAKIEISPLYQPLEVLGVQRSKAVQPSDSTTQRGTVFHERLHGDQAVPFIDDGHLALRVWCRKDAGELNTAVRYGLAVSIEAETAIPVYDEIQALLRVRPRP